MGSLISMGQSGAIQTRSEAAQGRIWQEMWPAMPAGSEDVQELLTTIENLFNTGATCTLTHYLLPGSGKERNGTGGGTPRVNGGSQSGTSLVTENWTTEAANRMKAGDCFTLAGLDVLFRVTIDATSGTSTNAQTLAIEPPIVAGSSPADEALLTVAGATITAVVMDYTAGTAGPDEFLGGVQVTFREAP
tara:strand:+ start:1163 stop:1732 length:570 start_codon:yes stop_codon:yes gene_type:complete